jgi:hypothetical protein
MPGSQGEVIGICLGLVWEWNSGKVGGSQGMDFWHDLKHRERSDALLTPLRCVKVAVSNCLSNHRRNKGITLRQDLLPPLMRDLLVSHDEQITAWPSCPVADDAGFNVDCGVHIHLSESGSLTAT